MGGDHLDVPLEDATLLEEVELISALMIAASEAEEQLDRSEIDRLLGVAPASEAAETTAGAQPGPSSSAPDSQEQYRP
jgi:hypothetical protein